MNAAVSNASPRSLASGAVAALCLVAVGILVTSFFSHANLPMPVSNDSVHEFADWMRGVGLWERTRHNGVASWGSSLGLYLDTEIGPYPVWSYAIGYSLLAVFIAFFAVVSRPALGTHLTTLFLSVFLLYWFLRFNHVQSISYVWRIPEVGQQLAALGSSIYILRFRGQLGSAAVLGLTFLTFVLSQTHGGYVIFSALLVFLSYLAESWRQRTLWLGLLAAYVAYMFAIDGTFATLVGKVSASSTADGPSLAEFAVATLGLQSQVPGNIFSEILTEAAGPVFQILFVGAVLFLVVHAIWRIHKTRDAVAVVYLFLVLSQLGIMALAVVGRFGAHGMDVVDVGRYSSYSVITLLATIWYAVTIASTRQAFLILMIVAVVALALVPDTHRFLDNTVTYFGHRMAKIYSVALSGKVQPLHDMDAREQTAFLNYVVPGLIVRRAAGFGPGPWSAVQGLGSAAKPVSECEGTLELQSRPSDSAYAVWDYQYTAGLKDGPDFGLAISRAGDVVALSPEIDDRKGRSMRFFVPLASEGVTFFAGKFGEGVSAQPVSLCRIEP